MKRSTERALEMDRINARLTKLLKDHKITNFEITGRPKHYYSIYRKMVRKGVPFDSVYDVRGVRIIVPDVSACYITLGLIHTTWRPIPDEFDDYVAAPKDNFYKSLHTAVNYEDGGMLEVQIRTPEMHQDAEYGVAAHWRYKEGRKGDDDYERRIEYWRSLLEWQQDVEDAGEFVDSLKSNVLDDRVYVFTPRGDIVDMPVGSTPIDFAYHIHTEIGHRCRGAKVNGKMVSLDYNMKTGEKIDIITAKRGGPSRDWLNPSLRMIKTQRARCKIRQWFKHQERTHNISQGRDLLDKELRRLGVGDINVEQLAGSLDFRHVEDLYVAIGCGDIPLVRVTNQVMMTEKDDDGITFATLKQGEPARVGEQALAVLGVRGLLTSVGRCCKPVPGEEIVGYVTRSDAVSPFIATIAPMSCGSATASVWCASRGVNTRTPIRSRCASRPMTAMAWCAIFRTWSRMKASTSAR